MVGFKVVYCGLRQVLALPPVLQRQCLHSLQQPPPQLEISTRMNNATKPRQRRRAVLSCVECRKRRQKVEYCRFGLHHVAADRLSVTVKVHVCNVLRAEQALHALTRNTQNICKRRKNQVTSLIEA